MLGYKKTEALWLTEFGIFLLIHTMYAALNYPGPVAVHIVLYAILFWLPPLLLYFFCKFETFVKYYTLFSAILCTYLIAVDTENLMHPLLVFCGASVLVAMFVDIRLLEVYVAVTLFLIVFFPVFHPNIRAASFGLKRYYMYIAVYMFMMGSLFMLVHYYLKYKEKLDAKTSEAIAANRSKSTFLANMSHEIRTPMNAITGMSELLLQGDLSVTEREYVNTIRNASDNLLEIINDILDFTKIDVEKLELSEMPYNIGTMVYELQNLIAARLIGKETDFFINMEPTIPIKLKGDDGRIRQMLLNILTNAVKFTPKGKIELNIDWIDMGERDCQLIFQVKDTGIGIREEEIEGLFDAFTQADMKRNRNIEGTGLGLAITRRIAEQMDGFVKLESQYGEGTCVTIQILQEVLDGKPLVKLEKREERRIYLYEPNRQHQKNFLEIAERLGEEVIILRGLNGLEEQIEDLEDSFLFYDIVNGREKVREFAKRTEHVRFVAIAGIQDQIGITGKDVEMFLRRPISIMSVGAALKNQKIGTEQKEEEQICLYAPEARVMVVDDNFVNLKVVEELLLLYGLDVTSVSSGYECIRLLERQKEYDIIFMDHMMPHLDGLETTKIIRDRERLKGGHRTIVALTANAVKGVDRMFIEQGMDDFLPKPVNLEHLEKILRKWIPKEKQQEIQKEPQKEGRMPVGTAKQIDVKAGIAGAGNREEIYRKVLETALMEGKKKIPLLRRYLAEDMGAYIIEVHALKSTMAGIGAMRLSQMAKEHELAGKAGDVKFVSRHSGELLDTYQEVLEEIEKMLGEVKAEEPDVQKREQKLNKGEILRKIQESLLKYESEEAYEWIQEAMRRSEHSYRLEKIMKYTEQLEYEKALKALEEEMDYDEDMI